MSTLKTGALRGTSGSADSIQLHASNQSVTFPGNVTFSGTVTGDNAGVLQIKYSTKKGVQSFGGGSWSDVGGMSGTITPASTNSKILIQVSLGRMNGGTSCDAAGFKMVRTVSGQSGVDIGIGNENSNRMRVSFCATRWDISQAHGTGLSWSWVDEPSTTSSVDYNLKIFPQGDHWHINRNAQYADGTDIYHCVAASSLILTEFAS